ncbi:MAG: tRNA epoxyqueuosine(34) reductase QueG [Planctomycetes bacterium]|jgi:epoxyqueuosine reductase|nr:tRNA epoxyqueuosine(34) reductase QueG [Phycisphaerae bacterium]NBB94422.1 tRNA epoxyqueuosine(34) reductase QueG [Planctomycetota bacterium]
MAADLTLRVKHLAAEFGFATAGIAPATAVDGTWRQRFEQWLAEGHAAAMDYMHRDPARRFDPQRVVDEARSVIVLATSYAPDPNDPVGDIDIARYARGRDYHKVLKKRAHALCDRLRDMAPDFAGRAFVDSAPVAEKSLAVLAGLGWIGRNGLLIVAGLGSYVLLTEIVCNLPLTPDAPSGGSCGPCRACIDVCPTAALLGDGLLNVRRCLSYRNKGGRSLPREYWPAAGVRVFGCDACQEVCPHNIDVPPGDPQLRSSPGRRALQLADLLAWSEKDFNAATRGSPVRRAGYDALMLHAVVAAGNARRTDLRGRLEALGRDRPALAEAVAWALARIEGD